MEVLNTALRDEAPKYDVIEEISSDDTVVTPPTVKEKPKRSRKKKNIS